MEDLQVFEVSLAALGCDVCLCTKKVAQYRAVAYMNKSLNEASTFSIAARRPKVVQ